MCGIKSPNWRYSPLPVGDDGVHQIGVSVLLSDIVDKQA